MTGQVLVLSASHEPRPDEAVAKLAASDLEEPIVIRTAPILLALAVTGSTAMAHPADAETGRTPGRLYEGISRDPSKAVTYTKIAIGDIDARSETGAKALLQRIEMAADAVCGGAPSAVSRAVKTDFEDCRDSAISGAVAKTRNATLTALTDRRHRDVLASR